MKSSSTGDRQAREFLTRYRDCLVTLDSYMVEARKMCELLQACNGNAANAVEQVALMAQRDNEDYSHRDYQRARRRLLRFARLNSLSDDRSCRSVYKELGLSWMPH